MDIIFHKVPKLFWSSFVVDVEQIFFSMGYQTIILMNKIVVAPGIIGDIRLMAKLPVVPYNNTM